MELKIEDMLGIYPPITADGFQSLMYQKPEFREKATPVDFKPKNEPGEPFPNQELFERYVRQYPAFALFAEAGTGKTCSLSRVVNYYMTHKEHIDHVYFFTGRTQVEDVLRQIVYTCHHPDVFRDKVEKMKTDKAKKGKITRITEDWYTVTTYSVFVNQHFPLRAAKKGIQGKTLTDDDIREMFRGCIFFLDEVQKLKIIPDVYMKGNLDAILRSASSAPTKGTPSKASSSYKVKSSSKPVPKKQRSLVARIHNYMQFWRILHLAENCIKIIASARPVSNILEEFVFHMNLILPLHLQLSEHKEIKKSLAYRIAKHLGFEAEFTYVNLYEHDVGELTKNLQPFLQGRVMYFRGFKIGAVPKYPTGEPEQFEHIINGEAVTVKLYLKYVRMSEHQRLAYNNIGKEEVGEEEIDISTMIEDERKRGKVKNSFHLKQRQAAGFVFPDGGYDIKTYEQYVVNSDDASSIKVAKTDKGRELARWLKPHRGAKGLRDMSAKMYDIVVNAYEQEGKRYVYSWLVKAGGAFLLALALQAGNPKDSTAPKFRQFVGDGEFFQNEEEGEACCGEESVDIKGEIVNLESYQECGYHRYAILFSGNKSRHNNIFKVFNSPQNVNGDYIKVIIVSRVGQIGINLSDCLHEDIMEPDFSPSSQYQGDMRIFRATAYINTINERMKRGAAERMTTANDVVEVNVNYLAVKGSRSDPPSIDAQVYQYARYKDILISRLARAYKRLSFDCHINYGHNIRVTDVDNSPECDYQQCPDPADSNTFCYDPKDDSLPLDTSTYDVYFIDELIKKLTKSVIAPYFRQLSSATVADLMAFQEQHLETLDFIPANLKQMYFALEHIITAREALYNSFGYKSYLAVEGDIFYVIHGRTLDQRDAYSASYYTHNLIGLSTFSLADINLRSNIDRSGLIWDSVVAVYDVKSKTNTEEIIRKITSLPNGAQTAYLEFVVSSYHYFLVNKLRMDAASEAVVKITLEHYRNKILRENAAYDPDYDARKPSIYVHQIYNPYAQKTRHGIAAQEEKAEGVLRILEAFDNTDPVLAWRDCSPIEQEKYRIQFSNFIIGLRSELAKAHEIYIWKNGDDYELADNRTATRTNKTKRGTNINTMLVPKLVEIAYYLNINHDEHLREAQITYRNWPDKDLREALIDEMGVKDGSAEAAEIDEFDTDRLLYYLDIITSVPASHRRGRPPIKGQINNPKALVGSIYKHLRQIGAYGSAADNTGATLPAMQSGAASSVSEGGRTTRRRTTTASSSSTATGKPRRGRPPGSKNRPRD